MDLITQSLTCCICLEVATLPVHSTCCDSAKAMPPVCMQCARHYLQIDNASKDKKTKTRKCWTGCGCDLKLKHKTKLYSHTIELESIRNLVGPSRCPHDACDAKYDTCAELRRHLEGKTTKNDKYGNCQHVMTKCEHCSYYDKKYMVIGKHYKETHGSIHCDVCNMKVSKDDALEHYNNHIRQLSKFSKRIKREHKIL